MTGYEAFLYGQEGFGQVIDTDEKIIVMDEDKDSDPSILALNKFRGMYWAFSLY